MSEHLQNFEDFLKSLNGELSALDEKHPADEKNDSCTKCLEKLNIYTRSTMSLLNSGWYHALHKNAVEVTASRSLCTDGHAKIQQDFNVVRNCLDNRIQLEEQAIDSLVQGKKLTLE